MSNHSKDSLEALVYLAEVGFLAADMGRPEKAIAIFSRLEKMRSDIPHPVMNQAIVRARFGELAVAIEILKKLLIRFPSSQIVKAVLGKCLTEHGDANAHALLEDVLKVGGDVEAIAIAQSCCDAASQRTRYNMKALTEDMQFFRHHNVAIN
jgi:tetratricopeptide (TPR) repeat protein